MTTASRTPRGQARTVVVTGRVAADTADALRELALRSDRTISSELNRAIRAHLAHHNTTEQR